MKREKRPTGSARNRQQEQGDQMRPNIDDHDMTEIKVFEFLADGARSS